MPIWPFRKKEKKPAAVRATGFSAADYSRLTQSLDMESDHIMRILRQQGKALRARSRQVAMNTPYGAKFVQMCVNNIDGPTPFKLQSKIKYNSGKLDKTANETIEKEYKEWGKPGNCDLEGRLSWADMQRLITRTLAVDGEVLIRKFQGTSAGPWGLQYQLIDVDRLDDQYNEELPGGNVVINGVEVDPQGRIVAYHLLKRKPKDWYLGVAREYLRIPADQIIHKFIPMFAEQVRGVPWMFAALLELHRIGKFEEAALIAAQVGAAKMGFYQKRDMGSGFGAPDGATKNRNGDFVQSAEPGEFGIVPDGYEFKEHNPNYPDAQVGPFLKSALRGVASGLNVAYHSLGNDLESVNFSAARAGVLEEREQWMSLQNWKIEHLMEPAYSDWLLNSLLMRRLPYSLDRLDKFRSVIFQPRRWQWVDPKKDAEANVIAINNGLKSRSQIISETGGDIEDVFDQLRIEQDMAADAGINIKSGNNAVNGGQDNAEDDNEE